MVHWEADKMQAKESISLPSFSSGASRKMRFKKAVGNGKKKRMKL